MRPVETPPRSLVGTLLVLVAGALAVPAALGVFRVVEPRLPRLGPVIGVLMMLSGLGLCAQVGFRGFVWSLVDQDSVPASSVDAFTAFQSGGLFDVMVAPGLVFGGLSTLLLIGALLRTRLVGWWVPVVMLVGMVLASGELPDVVTVAGAALGAVANLQLARLLFAGRS